MISVVICTCGRGESLKKSVSSVIKSASLYTDMELIVIDNAGNGQTEEVVKGFSQANPNLSLRYVVELNKGISHARNRGVKEASGSIIAFVDDDARVDANWLKQIAASLSEKPCIACGGKIIPVFSEEVPEWINEWGLEDKYNGIRVSHDLGQSVLEYKKGMVMPFTTNAAFKKEAFIRYGKFRTDLEISEDMEFAERLLSAGGKIIYNPEIKVFHDTDVRRFSKKFFYKWHFKAGFNEGKRIYRPCGFQGFKIYPYMLKNCITNTAKTLYYLLKAEGKNLFEGSLKAVTSFAALFGSITKGFSLIKDIRPGSLRAPGTKAVLNLEGSEFVEYRRTWEKGLCISQEEDFSNSLVQELSEFCKEEKSVTRRKIESAESDLDDKWDVFKSDEKDGFYKDNGNYYLYDLTNYHLQYGTSRQVAELVQFGKLNEYNRVLDYGSGIGSASIIFSENGFNMSLADISPDLLEYAGWRLAKRGYKPDRINTLERDLPENTFEMIYSLDVMEHVFDIGEVLDKIWRTLKPGSLFFFTVTEDENHPMHINTTKDVYGAINRDKFVMYRWGAFGVSMHAIGKR